MKLRTLFFILLIASLTSNAQDPDFSQFFASPLTLNPALTGKFGGSLRAAGNYRNQWPSIYNAYTTATISVDGGILKNTIPEFDQFGIGIMAFTDKSGNGVAVPASRDEDPSLGPRDRDVEDRRELPGLVDEPELDQRSDRPPRSLPRGRRSLAA